MLMRFTRKNVHLKGSLRFEQNTFHDQTEKRPVILIVSRQRNESKVDGHSATFVGSSFRFEFLPICRRVSNVALFAVPNATSVRHHGESLTT